MPSVSRPSRARSADRLSSSRFISCGCGQRFAKEAAIGASECLRAWMRAIRIWSVSMMRRGSRPSRPRAAFSLLEGNGVHQAALGPEPVQSALELQRARLAHVAFEDLAVIAAHLDR